MFYGLLFISEESRASNLKWRNFDDQMAVYIGNVIALSKSLGEHGFDFTVITNRAKFVAEKAAEINANWSLKIETAKFDLSVPVGLDFYSAHFKIDAFRFLGNLNKAYVGLIDIDMFCLRQPSTGFFNCILRKLPLYYDITDQVTPAHGHENIIRSMQLVSSDVFEGRWAGGEFIAGTPEFFKDLSARIDELWPRYLQYLSRLHHHGDEMIVSVALEQMRHSGYYMVDCGTLCGVGRFWSGLVKHHQVDFKAFAEACFLLHLPQDKKFIAKFAGSNRSVTKENFIGVYSRYLRWRKIRSLAISISRKYMDLCQGAIKSIDLMRCNRILEIYLFRWWRKGG